jgi:hypothetical protein
MPAPQFVTLCFRQGAQAGWLGDGIFFVHLKQVLLEKYKEKNAAVGKSVGEALSAMHKHCFALLEVAETLAGGRIRELRHLLVASAHGCKHTRSSCARSQHISLSPESRLRRSGPPAQPIHLSHTCDQCLETCVYLAVYVGMSRLGPSQNRCERCRRLSWPLTRGMASLAAALGHANPKVKEETLGWLKAEVGFEAKPALSKLAPQLLPPAAKCAEEAVPSLREAALAFMVAFAVKVRRGRAGRGGAPAKSPGQSVAGQRQVSRPGEFNQMTGKRRSEDQVRPACLWLLHQQSSL